MVVGIGDRIGDFLTNDDERLVGLAGENPSDDERLDGLEGENIGGLGGGEEMKEE
jgi:hypothetical protein